MEIQEYRFEVGSLTANSDGLFNVFSSHSINGEILSVSLGSNIHTNTGSYLLFFSGINNTGTLTGDLILRIRAGSYAQTFYPYYLLTDNQGIGGSFTNVILTSNFVGNAPLRLVGSGLGDGTSGLFVSVKYRY